MNAKNVTLKESWAAHTESSWYNSTSKAFHITTAKQLSHIASLVNSGDDNFAGDTIYIDNDIDLSGKYWEPIGKFEYRPFCGIIKGSNHTIKGLTICNIDSRTNISGSQANLKDDDYFGGFVGVSYRAQFHDLTLVNSDIYAESATTKAISFRVATLVARLKGVNSIINNCHSINPTIEAYCGISTPNKNANVDVAGLVGNIDDAPNTIIINSTVEGGSLTTNKYIGGIVGFIRANSYNCTIMNSICSANINNNSNLSYTSRNGGIISAIDGSTIGNTTIKNCIFTGTINGGKYSHAILGGKPEGLANTNDHSEYYYYSPKSRAKNFNPLKQQWAQHYKSAAGASMTGNKNASTGTLLSDSHMTCGNSEAIIAIGGTNYTLIDALALVARSYNNTATAATPLARGIICDGTTYRIAGYSISNGNYNMTLTVDSKDDYTKKYHIADAGTKMTITLTPKSSTSVIAQNSIVIRTTNGETINSSYATNTTNTSVKATFTMPADNVIIESEETALNHWINNGDATLQPQGNIYEISTAEQLAQIAYLSKNSNETFAGKTIKIMNDIDMQYSTIFKNVKMLWTPIENFRGTIEGNNHIISNLYIEEIEKSATHYGFIAKAASSTIKQLHLHNVKYTIISQNPNSMYMGGIVAEATSNNRIEECSVIGELTLYGNNKNSIDLGGIVGQMFSSSNTIINCFTSGKFESKRTVGGIVGYMNSKNSLTSSLSTAQVISKEHRAGGLVSAVSSDGSCRIKNSLFAGQVASGNNDCGAITGRDTKNMSIVNSYYDNQICTKKAVNNGTYDGKKQTTQLTGSQQASLFSSAIWHLEDGFYPRLKALKANTIMRSATAALYLNSTLDPNKIDNCDNVRFDIRLTAANDNTTPIAWATDNKQHIVWNNNDTAYIFPPEEEDKLINFYINDNEKIVRSIDLKLTKAIVINSGDYTELDDVTYNNVIIYDEALVGNENDYTIKGRLFYRRMLIDCSLWHTISFPADIDMVTVYNESSQKHYVRNYRTTSQDESGKTGGHYFLKRFSNQNVT